jgi:hypothetical protein
MLSILVQLLIKYVLGLPVMLFLNFFVAVYSQILQWRDFTNIKDKNQEKNEALITTRSHKNCRIIRFSE